MSKATSVWGSAVVALLCSTSILGSGSPTLGGAAGDKNWPQWRGPEANGVAPQANPPLKWSETENIKWKVATPGFGTSTPIVWDNKVFITTAMPVKKTAANFVPSPVPAAQQAPPPGGGGGGGGGRRGGGGGGGFAGGGAPTDPHQFIVLCIDRATGKTLWQKTAREEVPHEGHHQDHGFASASTTTDGDVLIAFFGSRGLYCYDLNGNLKWEKDFGDMRTRNGFGEGTSPTLHGNTVLVLWDHEGEDFIVALDKTTGKELWRQKRDEPSGWSTPLVVEHQGATQVVVQATGKVRSYNLSNGALIWECAGQTANAIPSPVTDGEVVYITSGFRGAALQAIKLGRTGDLSGTDAILWSHNRSTPYVPSPLLVDNYLYFIGGNNGMISCWDTKTGKPLIDAERLEEARGVYASPVAAKDRVYVLSREGTTVVLKKGPKLEILATNKLDDRSDASLALVGNEIFVRGHKNLYCIAEK